MSTESWPLWLTSAAIGVVFHHGYARHQEVDFSGWRIISIFSSINVALGYYFTVFLEWPLLEAVWNVLFAATVSVAAASCSILLYRGFFHRLQHIPGPFFARLSSFYLLRKIFVGLQTHIDLGQLHSKYGDVVRIGTLFTSSLGFPE